MQDPSMSGQQQLVDLLRQVHQAGKSGYIFYIARDGSSGKITVNHGVLCDIAYKNKPSSISDVVALDLNTLVLVQRTAEKQLAPSPGIPAIGTFIQALEFQIAVTESLCEPPLPEESHQEDAAQSHLDLTGAVIQLLTGLYGAERAGKHVHKVAGQWPPEQHPQQFLEKCMELAALMLGPEAAQEIFTPLYEKGNVR